MLNKIKLIGKVLPLEIKEKEEEKGLMVYFSLLVPNPSGSITILSCMVKGETAEKIVKELQEDDIAEVRGYLRNEKDRKSKEKKDREEEIEEYKKELEEKKKGNRQILTKVLGFKKLDLTFDELIEQA